MLHWLYGQLILTGIELKTELTIPHIVTGLVIYTIIHRLHKWGSSIERIGRKSRRKDRNSIITSHVKAGHKSRLYECFEGSCTRLRNLEQPDLVPELRIPSLSELD